MGDIPQFRYHSNPIETGAFKTDKIIICDCCEKETNIYYESPFYSIDSINALCPFCIVNGEAAKKFSGEFQSYTSIEGISPDPNEPNTFKNEIAIDEVIHRTPGYVGWQEARWLSHCDDLCAFIGYVCFDDIKDKLNDFVDLKSDIKNYNLSIDSLQEYLINNGTLQGYLFQCLKCKKYRLHLDCD